MSLRSPVTRRLTPSTALTISATLLVLGAVHASSHVVEVVTFTGPDLPHVIAIDKRGNKYLSMFLTGELRKIAPDGTLTTVAVLGTGAPPRFLTGLAADAQGNIYAALNDVPATRGIWRVSRAGAVDQIAALPAAVFLNALAFDARGNLYVSDQFTGVIYRLARDGSVSVWSSDALLQVSPGLAACPWFMPSAANGLAFNKQGDLLVAHTSDGAIVRIPVGADGSAGPGTYFALPTCSLVGADHIAFDNRDNLYVAVNSQDKIVRISPDGAMETLASGPVDPLYFPAHIAFGTGLGERKQIFITNLAPFSEGFSAAIKSQAW
jgi:hypothetical protein